MLKELAKNYSGFELKNYEETKKKSEKYNKFDRIMTYPQNGFTKELYERMDNSPIFKDLHWKNKFLIDAMLGRKQKKWIRLLASEIKTEMIKLIEWYLFPTIKFKENKSWNPNRYVTRYFVLNYQKILNDMKQTLVEFSTGY